MTHELSKYLEIAHAGNAEGRKLAQSIPRALGHYDHENKLVSVRELLLTEAIESTTLIQTEVYKTVMEGAQPAICMREALPTINMTSKSMDIVKRPAGRYAGEVAEGAEIPIKNDDYSKATFTAKKYGERPLITKELIEDSQFDVIAMEIQAAGRAIENTLNQVGLTELLDDAGLEHDTAGSNQGIKAVAAAIGVMKKQNYIPTDIILAPLAESMVMKEFVPTGYTGADAVMAGRLPNMLGLNVHNCNVTDASGTYTWDYDADGEIGMILIDKFNCGAIGMRRDITIEKYDDPIRDLMGMSVTARFDVDSLQTNAICRVEY